MSKQPKTNTDVEDLRAYCPNIYTVVYALGDNEKFASLQKLGKYSKKLFLTALFNHVKIESYQGCYYELHGMVQRLYNVKMAMYVR